MSASCPLPPSHRCLTYVLNRAVTWQSIGYTSCPTPQQYLGGVPLPCSFSPKLPRAPSRALLLQVWPGNQYPQQPLGAWEKCRPPGHPRPAGSESAFPQGAPGDLCAHSSVKNSILALLYTLCFFIVPVSSPPDCKLREDRHLSLVIPTRSPNYKGSCRIADVLMDNEQMKTPKAVKVGIMQSRVRGGVCQGAGELTEAGDPALDF